MGTSIQTKTKVYKQNCHREIEYIPHKAFHTLLRIYLSNSRLPVGMAAYILPSSTFHAMIATQRPFLLDNEASQALKHRPRGILYTLLRYSTRFNSSET